MLDIEFRVLSNFHASDGFIYHPLKPLLLNVSTIHVHCNLQRNNIFEHSGFFLLALPSTYVNIYISTKQTYAHKNAVTNCIANRKTEMFRVCCFKYFS